MGYKNVEWTIEPNVLSKQYSYDQASLAVLMDIRQELRNLNSILNCSNTLAIPRMLRSIELNTRPKKKK